jgi:hypothetical protein
MFVDIGDYEHGVVLITMLQTEPRSRDPVMPAVGQRVEGMLLGFSGPGRQPRISWRPSDVSIARIASGT